MSRLTLWSRSGLLVALLGLGGALACSAKGSDGDLPQGTGGSATGGAATGGKGGTGGSPATGGAPGTGGAAGGAATGGSGGRGGGGRGGSSGGAGATGTGGTSGGGSSGAVSCLNGKKDGSETGVDCGGSCPACPTYKINAPNLNNMASSGCSGGNGYMCARSMVFSPEFKQAAMDDWGMDDPPFVYGVVGHDKDSGGIDSSGGGNTCCQCYQLVFEQPSDPVSGLPSPKPMIVQVFNTAAGGGKNFDIYMATGGYGNFNGCAGGSNPMYDGFPTVGEPGKGGVRPINFSQQCSMMDKYTLASVSTPMCQDQIGSQCNMLSAKSSASNEATSRQSCIEGNQPENLYHLNWKVRAKRVECPTNLTRVTGCKLGSQGLPAADPTAKDAASASSFTTGYGTTTMQDCCRPTCAYNTNVKMSGASVDGSYGAFYTCDKSGNPS